jgi:hypothetical protein
MKNRGEVNYRFGEMYFSTAVTQFVQLLQNGNKVFSKSKSHKN